MMNIRFLKLFQCATLIFSVSIVSGLSMEDKATNEEPDLVYPSPNPSKISKLPLDLQTVLMKTRLQNIKNNIPLDQEEKLKIIKELREFLKDFPENPMIIYQLGCCVAFLDTNHQNFDLIKEAASQLASIYMTPLYEVSEQYKHNFYRSLGKLLCWDLIRKIPLEFNKNDEIILKMIGDKDYLNQMGTQFLINNFCPWSQNLLLKLAHLENPSVFNFMLRRVKSLLFNNIHLIPNPSKSYRDLVSFIYDKLQGKGPYSISLLRDHAQHLQEKLASSALNIYEVIMNTGEDNVTKWEEGSMVYQDASVCAVMLKDYEKAIAYQSLIDKCSFLEKETKLFGSELLSRIYFVQGKYEEALPLIRYGLADSSNPSIQPEFNFLLRVCLKQCGREEELNQFLQKDLERKLEQAKERAARVKLAIEQERREKIKKAPKKGTGAKSSSTRKSTPTQKIVLSEDNLYYDSYRETSTTSQKFIPTLKSQKKKTQGIANKNNSNNTNSNDQVDDTQLTISEPNKNSSLRIRIEDLIKGTPYKIFCDLFGLYDKSPTKLTSIHITLNDIGTLMTALGQDYNKSKGKGDHSKATVNSYISGFDEEVKNKVLILAKAVLLPYQIQDFVNMFLAHGFYPDYLEDTLRAKGLIS